MEVDYNMSWLGKEQSGELVWSRPLDANLQVILDIYLVQVYMFLYGLNEEQEEKFDGTLTTQAFERENYNFILQLNNM